MRGISVEKPQAPQKTIFTLKLTKESNLNDSNAIYLHFPAPALNKDSNIGLS